MSIRYSEKCSKEIARKFMIEVKKWCDKNKIPYKKIRGLIAYEGEVRIYNGLYENRPSYRRVLQKDEGGYFRAKTTIRKPMFISVFRDEWKNPKYQADEKRAIKSFFNL